MNNFQRTEVTAAGVGITVPRQPSMQRDFPLTMNQCTGCSTVVIKNDLLAGLPAKDQALLTPHLEFVYLPADKQLFEVGDRVAHVYFPTTVVVALLYLLSNGNTLEIAVVGNDGMLGLSAMLGESALGTAIVQSAGYAYKLKAPLLREICGRSDTLQKALLRYTQLLFEQIAQNSVSCRHFSIEQQLCRWLLNRLDRLPTNVLKMTQAMIASMLGVRRESITGAASRLQQEGLIQYRRGSITVLDRVGLEEFAGECYQPTRQAGQLIVSPSTLR